VEPAGGGRVVLDIKGTERLWGDNFAVADSLRHAVQATCRLPAAAGLAVRRPWSLLASRAAGEDGVCHIPPGEEDDFLNQVPVAWVDGLTPQTRTLLTEMNIRSLGQIRHCGRLELGRQFGRSSGDTLWNVLHPSEWDSVSFLADDALLDMAANRIRIEAALAEASVEREKMRLVVRDLAARAATALRSKRLGAARLRLTLLHADGALKTAGGRTGGFIQHEAALQRVAEGLLARVFVRRVQVIRLWLDAEKLATPERQGTLFQANASAEPDSGDRDSRKLLRAVDRIKKRYGESAMQPAALLQSAARQKQLALASRDTA
jgi:Nucleotidyltransferase/DNA polymerase involved in DNA repair